MTLSPARHGKPWDVRRHLHMMETMSKTLRVVATTQHVQTDDHRSLYAFIERTGATIKNALPLTSAALSEIPRDGKRLPQAGGHMYTTVLVDVAWKNDITELRKTLRPDSLQQAVPGYDINVVDPALSRAEKLMLILDADSTLLCQEAIDELAARAGVRHEVAEVTERAMRGELDFAQSLEHRVSTLKGQPVSVLAAVSRSLTLTPGAKQLVDAFHARDFPVCVVSGGFIQVLEPIARQLDLEFARANRLEIENEQLTGSCLGTVVDAHVKQHSLKEWAKSCGVKTNNVIAVGDGANDRLMLDAAGLGVAFNAKEALRQDADAQINIRRLDAVRHFVNL